MPYYLDRHDMSGVTAEDVAASHVQDLAVEDQFGVKWLSYWFDQARQTTFCLVDAPSAERAQAAHAAAHGLIAGHVVPVDRGAIEMFLGQIVDPAESGQALPAFRAIMFTDMEGSTAQTQHLGDDGAMKVLRHHDSITRAALDAHRGVEVKHTGDGIMASFESVTDVLGCAISVQRGIAIHNSEAGSDDERFRVRIGIGAGEPLTQQGDLFGAAVQLAARLCDSASPGHICVSEAVRDLAIGKRFPFGSVEELDLKGFEAPVRVVSLDWQNAGEG